jgi:hypothetical protein
MDRLLVKCPIKTPNSSHTDSRAQSWQESIVQALLRAGCNAHIGVISVLKKRGHFDAADKTRFFRLSDNMLMEYADEMTCFVRVVLKASE